MASPGRGSPVAPYPRGLGGVGPAIVVTVASSVPLFLLLAVTPELRRDFDLTLGQLGVIVAAFHLAGGAYAGLGAAAVAARLGMRRSTALVFVLTAAIFVGFWGLASSWLILAVLVAVAGATQAQANVTANLMLSAAVRIDRQAFFFGVKQSATPVATLIAGLFAPVAVGLVGWRWTALGLAVVVVVIGFVASRGLLHRAGVSRVRAPLSGGRTRALVVLATAAALASAAGVSMSSFLVEAAVRNGMTLAAGGLVLSLSSLFAIFGRLAAGWFADRRGRRHFVWVALMCWGGGVGLLVVGFSTGAVFVCGALVAACLGQGWNGLFHFAIVHTNRDAPATPIGLAQAGIYLGGGLGPASFGFVADRYGDHAAWTWIAALMALSGGLLLAGRGLLGRSLRDDSLTGDQR